MNLSNKIDHQNAFVVGFGVRTLLISGGGGDGPTARKLGGLGCQIESCEEIYAGLARVMDDPSGYSLVVIDCDSVGGLTLGLRAHAMLKVTQRCIPVLLISGDCEHQNFPESRHEPTILRAPLSSVSLRVGFEHALQERLFLSRAS